MTRRAIWILALALGLRVACATGPRIVDEFAYLNRAAALRRGTSELGMSPADYRWGLVGPTALAQAAAGVNLVSTGAVGCLSSMAYVLLTFFLVRRLHSERAGLLAALAMAVSPLEVSYATALFPDVPAAALMALGVWLFLRGHHAWAGVALGGAHLCKETAFFALILLLFLRDRRVWMTLAAFAVVVGLESALYGAATGTPLARWDTFESGTHRAALLRDFGAMDKRLDRVFLQMPKMFFWPKHEDFPYFAITGVAAMASLAAWRHVRFFAGWAGLMLFLINFWPNTVVPYLPGLHMAGRYATIAMLPLCAMIGIALSVGWDRRIVRWTGTIGLAAHALLCLVLYAHRSESTVSLSGAADFLKSRPDARVITDGRSVAQLHFRLQGRPGVSSIYSTRPVPGSRVVVHELNTLYAELYREAVPVPAENWTLVYEERRSCRMHGWRNRLLGAPSSLWREEYAVRIYEVR